MCDRFSISQLLTWIVIAGGLLAGAEVCAQISTRTVILSGDPAAGTSPGIVYQEFNNPVINRHGELAFIAEVSGAGVTSLDNQGIWTDAGGTYHMVARRGDVAPGTEPGVEFRLFLGTPVLNSLGEIAFVTRLGGTGVNNFNSQSIWSDRNGHLELVVRGGQAAPGFGDGATFISPGDPMFNDAGHIAFNGTTIGPGLDNDNNRGLWSDAGGALELVARESDAAPGTSEVYDFISSRPNMNGSGVTYFYSLLSGAGYDFFQNQSLWAHDTSGAHAVGLSGDPTGIDGVIHNTFGVIFGVNDAGEIAFYSGLTGAGTDPTNNSGIFSGLPGEWDLVARKGQAAPGTAPGIYFSDFGSAHLGGSGASSFWGFVSGPGVDTTNDRGIWSDGTGELRLVFREGDHAPGTELGVRFLGAESDHVINGAGQVGMIGYLTGEGVTESNFKGIWATQPNGLLSLIARSGDLFDVNRDPAIDDLRVIEEVGLFMGYNGIGGEDGHGTSFSDDGELVFRLEFTDGTSGIFVAAVPEPGTGALLAVAFLLGLKARP